MKKRLTLFVAAIGILCTSFASADEVKPLKALLILGGCCHDYAAQKDILKNGLEARLNIKVDIEYSDEKGTKPEFECFKKDNWAEGYDVIIHDECAAGINDAGVVKRILAPHQAGLPAVALHCAMHSYRVAPNFKAPQELGSEGGMWFEFLGLQSSGHGPKKPIEVSYQQDASPIVKGLENYTSGNDELYNNHHLYEGVTVLAKGKQGNAESVVAWKHEYGANKARVFGTTLGHFNEIVADDKYLDFISRALLWSTKKLDDEGKPAEGYWIEK